VTTIGQIITSLADLSKWSILEMLQRNWVSGNYEFHYV